MKENAFLNEENIAMSTAEKEYHPLKPFLPKNARILFLGSFPPQRKRWRMPFYYPNFLNDHWRIEGEAWFGNRNRFIDIEKKTFLFHEIVEFCSSKGIAFFDTATAVRRLKDNASDKFLEVVEPTDIKELVSQLPRLRAIVTTGEKASLTLCNTLGLATIPKTREMLVTGLKNESGEVITLYRLPSSSRAYPLAFEKKVEAYKQLFNEVF